MLVIIPNESQPVGRAFTVTPNYDDRGFILCKDACTHVQVYLPVSVIFAKENICEKD